MKAGMRAAVAVAAPLAFLLGAHVTVQSLSRIRPPEVRLPALSLSFERGARRAGRGSVKHVGKILQVRLEGSPVEIGAEHARLLGSEMIETEQAVWNAFEQQVPSRAARLALLDLGQFAYRHVAAGFEDARLRELAGSALAFQPDPFVRHFDTFQRFVYLSALYDISLAYERSPLLGCTTFTFSGARAAGSPLLARAFDFEVDPVFDQRKAVFLVLEDGKIPFASVAWPGLVGVVSGMNREGVAVVVHGARAGVAHAAGEPLVHELRRVLGQARTTADAVRALAETDPLVSHLVVVSDAAGTAVKVERVPGAPPFSLPLGESASVTNHLEGPFAADPKNQRVRASSTTLARRARGDALVRALDHPVTVVDAVKLLRDRRGEDGSPLPLGDRRAIDALIATHAVVMETAARTLWVSEGPHLLGRFIAFDLPRLLGSDEPPGAPDARASIPEDALLESGEYARFRARLP